MDNASFTLKNESGLSRSLITLCGISEAYNPALGGKHPGVFEFKGLWDTGATNTVLSKKVVEFLGLKPIAKTKVGHGGGFSITDVFKINIFLPNNIAFAGMNATLGSMDGFDVIIGMDIITKGDFSITNLNGKTTFSFRIPSQEHIDFTKEKSIPSPSGVPVKKIQRNDPCSCGSGKKYKYCHGK